MGSTIKRLMSASVLSFMAAQTVFASTMSGLMPGLQSLLREKAAPAHVAKTAHAKNDAPYVDFSGKWVGHCEDSGFDEIELSIEHDGQGMILNGVSMRPDNITGLSNSNPQGRDSAYMMMEWVDANQALLFTGGAIEFEREDSHYKMTTLSMQIKLRLEAEQLKQEGIVKYSVDGQETQISMNCSYKKQ